MTFRDEILNTIDWLEAERLKHITAADALGGAATALHKLLEILPPLALTPPGVA